MTACVAGLAELRRRFPQLGPRHWVEGRRADGSSGVLWLTPRRTEMTEQDWNFPAGCFSHTCSTVAWIPRRVIVPVRVEPIKLNMPRWPGGRGWSQLIDTTVNDGNPGSRVLESGETATAPSRSVLVFEGVK